MQDPDNQNRDRIDTYRNESRELLTRAHAQVNEGDYGSAVELLR